MSYTQLSEPIDVPPDKHFAFCIRCTAQVTQGQVVGVSHQPHPGNGLRFASGVVKLGVGHIYYCATCGPDLRYCRVCGCTDEVACIGGCFWSGPELCSTCDAAAPKAAGIVCPACESREIVPRWMEPSREYFCRACHEVFTVEEGAG
jgi:hypothetical protein